MSDKITKEFEKELIQLLQKYNASMISCNTTIRVLFWDDKKEIKEKIKSHGFNLSDKIIK